MKIDIPVQRWYQAISNRHSKRNFLKKPLSKNEINELTNFMDNLNNGISGVRAIFKKDTPENIFQGIIGSYGSISGAPSYVAFIGEKTAENVNEKIGYIGEAFILEATSQGLGTCWIGGFFDETVAQEDLNLTNNQKIYAISPVGYPDNSFSLGNKLLKTVVRSNKRKKLNKLCNKDNKEKWTTWQKTALKCARLAPSAVNRQPWRFKVENKSIKVYFNGKESKTKISKKLDCGIAMLHLEIGAKYEGKNGKWLFLDDKPYIAEYIIE